MTSKSNLVCSTPVTTPVKTSYLSRPPFSPITNHPSSPISKTPHSTKVAFAQPDSKIRKTPRFVGIKTPSGLLTPFKSPRKRTLSGSKPSFSPSRAKHLRSRSAAKTPSGTFRRKLAQPDAVLTPSALISNGYSSASPFVPDTASTSIIKMYTTPVSGGIRRRIASSDFSVRTVLRSLCISFTS